MTHPESRKKFDAIHHDFAQFFLDAAKYFVSKNHDMRVFMKN
jgi:hypothetical protein